MANRFTDTDIWRKPWFRKASPKIKCLFRYMVDNCDHAGILDIDMGLISYMIGEEITDTDIKELSSLYNRIDTDKIFIPSFVTYQYKVSDYHELNQSNNAHKGVINQLKKYNLLGAKEGLKRPSRGAQDKDIEQDKVKDKVKDVRHKYGSYKNILLSDVDIEKLKKEFPRDWKDWIERVDSYCECEGKSYKNYLATIRTWSKRDSDKNKPLSKKTNHLDMDEYTRQEQERKNATWQ